ncbi:hypothetical protein EYR40_009374 [Pleurotus pulmonarius]|nr:hypothetical protein EYR40_009374 [Pleurotus pulmonarius]
MAKDSNKSKKRASTASTSSASLNGDPNTDKVTIYTSDTLNRGLLIERTEEILGKKPFDWQIDAAAAVLCGEDVVLDVGTGCGKSLCFSIPLVLNNTDVALRITPLTALMIDQAESSKLQSIALCIYESGVSEEEIGEGLDDLGSQEQTEAENHSQELPMNVPNAEGVVIDEMGERMEQGSEDEIGDEPKAKGKEPAKRRKKTNNVFNSHEAKALTSYMGTRGCRWKVWDNFFRNSEKLQLNSPTVTTYTEKPGMRCCDRCHPERFPVETIRLSKAPGQLKRGRKQTFSERSATTIRTALVTWRDTVLIQHVYPNLVTIAGSAILGDDVIDKIVASGIKLDSAEVFSRHVRWAYGFDSITAKPNECGTMLLHKLRAIYAAVEDTETKELEKRQVNLAEVIPPENFYAGPSRRPQRQAALRAV